MNWGAHHQHEWYYDLLAKIYGRPFWISSRATHIYKKISHPAWIINSGHFGVCIMCTRELLSSDNILAGSGARTLKNIYSMHSEIKPCVCVRVGKQNYTPASAAAVLAVCERANIKHAWEGSEMCCAHHQMIVYLLQAVNLGFTLCQCRTKVFACRRHTHYALGNKTTKNAQRAHSCFARAIWALQDSWC